MFFLSLWLYTHIMKVPHRRPQLGTHQLLIKSWSFFVFIYLHIIAFILECKLESRKLWALGFFSLIPYLPEEPEVMHLSIWGLVTPKKNILFSSLLCSLKSCVWSLSHWPGEPRGCSAPEISFLAEFGACRAALAGLCCYVLPSCLGKGRRGRCHLLFILKSLNAGHSGEESPFCTAFQIWSRVSKSPCYHGSSKCLSHQL